MSPSFAQRLLIRRTARAMLRLELLDAKMSSGDWTDHDARTFGGLNNALRLALRELGVRETKQRLAPTPCCGIRPRRWDSSRAGLALRELGVRETQPKPIPTIAEIAARHKSEGA